MPRKHDAAEFYVPPSWPVTQVTWSQLRGKPATNGVTCGRAGPHPAPFPLLRSADLNSRIYSPGQMGVYGSLCYLVTGFLLLVEVEKSCSAVDQLRTVLRGPRASIVSHSPLSACFGCV